MFHQQLKAIKDVNIELSITTEWFHINVDPNHTTRVEFLKLNEVFPIGESREQAYLELMQKKIQEADLVGEYTRDTEKEIRFSEELRIKYTEFMAAAEKAVTEFVEKYESVKDAATYLELEEVYKNTDIKL